MQTEKQGNGDRDRRDLLGALADDTHSALLDRLDLGSCTQAELAEACGLSLSVVSRGLTYLRALGLIASERGRDAHHALLAREEMVAVLQAADRLQASIIERRRRQARTRTAQTDRAARNAGTR